MNLIVCVANIALNVSFAMNCLVELNNNNDNFNEIL